MLRPLDCQRCDREIREDEIRMLSEETEEELCSLGLIGAWVIGHPPLAKQADGTVSYIVCKKCLLQYRLDAEERASDYKAMVDSERERWGFKKDEFKR